MNIWIAVFYATVAGMPMDVNDYDQPRFRNKRACYVYILKNIPKARQVILEHLPVAREQVDIWGECKLEGSERASN